MNVYDVARVSMVLSRRRIPMILAFDKSLRKSARQTGHQSPQRRQMFTLRLERHVIIKNTECLTEVIARPVNVLSDRSASARRSTRSFDVRIVHDDPPYSLEDSG